MICLQGRLITLMWRACVHQVFLRSSARFIGRRHVQFDTASERVYTLRRSQSQTHIISTALHGDCTADSAVRSTAFVRTYDSTQSELEATN